MKTSEVCQINEKKNKKNKELGASLVEYGLLIALVALVAIPSVKVLGTNIHDQLFDVKEQLANGGIDNP